MQVRNVWWAAVFGWALATSAFSQEEADAKKELPAWFEDVYGRCVKMKAAVKLLAEQNVKLIDVALESDRLTASEMLDLKLKRTDFTGLLKALQDPEAVVPPDLPDAGEMKKGQMGALLDNARIGALAKKKRKWTVAKIVDETNAVLQENDGLFIWIEGPDTSDFVDGQAVNLKSMFEVVGTKAYDSDDGKKTVRHLKQLDFTASLAEIKRRQVAAAKADDAAKAKEIKEQEDREAADAAKAAKEKAKKPAPKKAPVKKPPAKKPVKKTAA